MLDFHSAKIGYTVGYALRTIRTGINIIIFVMMITPPPFDELRPWILVRKPLRCQTL
jgi:hypothetical protein